ncbi:hypothetical protein [Nocardia sp. NPDC051463]|uniref:hypothetical protein n=1 Tax=Nocardia sp. NPDC051463 TaxID=3154845 RepID=UPI00344F81BC
MTENTRTVRAEDLHETESETEQRMRSDFMHAWASINRAPQDYDPADEVDHAEYANPWLSGDARWMNEWIYLEDATLRYSEDRESAVVVAAELHEAGELSPIELRSERQAHYLAEHGIERSESGLLTSHYVTRVLDHDEYRDPSVAVSDVEREVSAHFESRTPERQGHGERDMPWANAAEVSTSAPVPVSSGFAAARTAALADYQPGNALAVAMANIERDGVER